MKKVQLSYFFLAFSISWGFAQCPTVSFDVPVTVCLEESLFLSNLQNTSSDYTWDFCSGDILNEGKGDELTTLTALSNLRGIVTEYETGNGLIGFAIGENNKLVRIRFGETIDPANIQVQELTTVSSFLNVPRGIAKVVEGSQKYLLIANSGNGSLVRVSFGTTYTTASPARAAIAGPVGLAGLRGLSAYRQGSRLVAFVSGTGVGNSQVGVLDFPSGITSVPVQSTINIPGAGGLNQVRVLNDCGQWLGLVGSFTQDRVYKLFFGNDLRTLESSQSVDGIPGALASEIRIENGHYYGLISTTSGSFWRIGFGPDFGAEDQTQLENLSNLGVLSNITGFSICERNSETVALAVGFSDKKLSAIRFADACAATVLTSKAANPSGLTYSLPGLKNITLTGSDASGNVQRVSRQLTVQNSQAPQADFSIGTGNCANSAINFTSSISSGSVSEYQWFFDGVQGVTTASASFTFAAAGEHTVRLVVGDGVCTNTIEKKVTIYEEVTPATYTLVGSLCTNNQVAVSNTTSDAAYPEETVRYRWFLDGAQISTAKAPTITFPTSGAHALRVVRSIPGCSAEITENLFVNDGPAVSMDFANSCWDAEEMEANVNFSTSVTGDNYIYTWDFGDNSTAQEATPTHTYSTPGDYNVSVTVLDENTGCSISTTPQLIGIRDQPLTGFDIPVIYDNLPVEFLGLYTGPLTDEVVSWKWNFADAGESEEQNPSFSFTMPGLYNVSLETVSARGCEEESTREVQVFEYPCPVANFSAQESICKGGTVRIENNSAKAERFEWDFCEGDLHQIPIAAEIGTLGAGLNTRGLAVAFDEKWYMFSTSRAEHTIRRIEIGVSLVSTSLIIENMGNPGGLLNNPEPILILKENGNWYGFIINGGRSELIRLNFGSSLGNAPSAEVLLSEIGGADTNLKYVKKDGQNYILMATYLTNSLTVINLGSTLAALPEDIHTVTNQIFPGSNNFFDISLVNECLDWFGIAISHRSRKIYKLRFGSDLMSAPIVDDITGGNSFLGDLGNIQIERDSEEYLAYVSTITGQLYKINFGVTLSTAADISAEFLSSVGVLSGTRSLNLVKENSTWRGFSINSGSGRIFKISFPDKCEGSRMASTEEEPRHLSYDKPGEYVISLKALTANGGSAYFSQKVTVTDDETAPIDFALDDSRCLGNTNQFNFIGDATIITSYSWDFDGDGVEDSNEPNPAWQFPAAGEYEVTLTVGNANGCTNSAKKTIPIYNVPSPVFEYEATAVMCSHQAIKFNDLTEGLPEDEAQVTYLWDFNGEGTSAEKNPTYAFETAGQKTIILTIGIPGCEGTSSQNMVLVAGSKVAFNIGNQCEDAETTFENLTTGDGITGYQWEFGNGYTSTQASPSVVFDAAGDYNVKLTATNQLGCENTLTKKISQRGVPRVDFTNDLACSGTTMQFTDKTTVPLANVAQWSWDFGGLGMSTAKNPQFVFPAAGEYNVTLTATSNYGCSATLVKKITVVEGATANFTVNSNCVGLPVTFTGQSTSAVPITSRFWTINGKSYTTANVSQVFTTAGQYEVTLEVTNSNLCTSSLTKTFEVYPLPQASFEFNSSCTNEQIEFVAASDTQVDVISRVWDFAGQAPANGARAYHQFKQAGDYAVSLQVTSADGCRSATTKTVSVNQAPTAAFSHTSPYGQLPVSVQFSDISTGSTDRMWFVGDGLEPSSEEQVFSRTFEQEGSYLVSLLSLAGNGCSDTLSRVIKVAPPKLDLQLKAINYTESNGVLRFVPTIVNRGTMDVSGFTILINIDDKVTASEVYEGTVEAGQTLSPSLAFELVPGQNGVKKVCMELMLPSIDSEEEFSPFDNYNCLSVSGTFHTGLPYPNPVEERIAVDVILPADGEVEIAILTLSGQPVTAEKYTDLKAGLTTFTYEVAHYKPGLYLLRIRSGGVETIQRIVKR